MQSPNLRPRALMSSKEVCDLARFHKATLTRHVQEGKITPVARIGSKPNALMLFHRPDVLKYLAEIGRI